MADSRSLVLLGLMGGLFLAAMDATVLAIAMPDVVEDLGREDLYAWGFASYMLAVAVSMPVLGAFGDRHGHKRFFLMTLGIFVAGSIACGLAPSMPAFLAARVVQGIGGGGMLSLPFAMAGAIFTGRERGRAVGRLSSVWGIAAIAGPLVGAAAVRLLSWEWVFYINIPVGLAGGWLVARHHLEERPRAGPGVDLLGALFLMAGVGGVLVALEEGVPQRGAFAAAGALLLAAFFWRERQAEAPILPVRLLGRRRILSANVASALAALAIFAPIAFVPLFVEQTFGEGRAVFAVFPLSIAWSGTSTLAGPHLHARRIPLAALGGLALLSLALLVSPLLLAQGLFGVASATFLMGVGMGLLTPALLLSVQNAVDVSRMGTVTASQTFLRNVGGAVGIVALGALIPPGLAGTLVGLAPSLYAAGGVAAAGIAVAAAGFVGAQGAEGPLARSAAGDRP